MYERKDSVHQQGRKKQRKLRKQEKNPFIMVIIIIIYNGLSAHAKVWLLAKHCCATSSIFYQHITGSEPIPLLHRSLPSLSLSHSFLTHSVTPYSLTRSLLTHSLGHSLTHSLTNSHAISCIILSLTRSVLSDFLLFCGLPVTVSVLRVERFTEPWPLFLTSDILCKDL